jgi:hypothetical protein
LKEEYTTEHGSKIDVRERAAWNFKMELSSRARFRIINSLRVLLNMQMEMNTRGRWKIIVELARTAPTWKQPLKSATRELGLTTESTVEVTIS